MVQFNLIPPVKKEYLRVQRFRDSVIFISSIVTGVSFLIFLNLLVYVTFIQGSNLHNIDNTVQKQSSLLTGNSNLNKILTIQNQLSSLPQIESNLPKSSRLFAYINQLTPTSATISSMSVDFTQNTLSITGAADSLATVNQFIDTLKFTKYTTSQNASNSQPAFSSVVLNSFSYNSTNTSNPANYTIDFNFDSNIFSNSETITLEVPNQVTTRSIIDQPTDIFKASNNVTTVK